jgi:hypothetical protein
MADSNQYLRIVLDGAGFLLPSAASIAIEQRDGLMPDDGNGAVVAWRQARNGRWPAYGLTASFQPGRPKKWQRALFLEVGGRAVGLVAEEVSLLSQTDMHVAPFAPLGAPPTRFGHFFNAAWVDGPRIMFVVDPRALGGFLQSLGGVA